MNTLYLRLEGPLQAWGLRARWGERDSADAPTKSGVIGLLGCALGLPRGDRRLSEISAALRFGVRTDLAGSVLRDYHTTGGGRFGDVVHSGSGIRYRDEPYAGGVLSAEVGKHGRIRVKINAGTKEPETDVSERHYLTDASFLAALQGDRILITELGAALQAPHWPYFLGRKACIAAVPVYAGTAEQPDLQSALSHGPWSARGRAVHRGTTPLLRCLIESRPGDGRPQPDNLIGAATRIFQPRYVHEVWLECRLEDGAATAPINTMEG